MRVTVADDHPLMCAGICSVLEAAGIEVLGVAQDGTVALDLIEATQPDIAILDVAMPGLDGIAVARRLREHGNQTTVVLLTAAIELDTLVEAIHNNVRGVLLKDGAETRLVEVLRSVAAGERVFPPDLMERALAKSLDQPEPSPFDSLTAREQALVDAVARGLSNREIASALHLSEGTVKVYLSRIFDKVGVRSRTALAAMFYDHGRNA